MGQERAATLTPVDVHALFQALQDAWRAMLGTDAPLKSIALLCGQSALETGYWQACWNHCLGNQKSHVGAAGDWTFYPCGENLPRAEAERLIAADPQHCRMASDSGGAIVSVAFAPKHPMCCFASYETLEAGAAAWLEMQYHVFSHAWPALLAGDPRAFAESLHECGYFTAPVEQYASALTMVFNHLEPQLPQSNIETADPAA